MLPILIYKRGDYKREDSIVIKLAEVLFDRLGDLVVSVESYEGCDGSNIKIVLKDVEPGIIDRVMDIIWETEVEIGEHGKIIPKILSFEEAKYLRDVKLPSLSKDVIDKLSKMLFDRLGDLVVSVESYEGCDGSNVKIVLKDIKPDIVDKVMDVIWEIETEMGEHGNIIPYVVESD